MTPEPESQPESQPEPRRRPDPPRYESPVDKAIREAMERGEFDDLPGAGKPLTNLGDPNDALWWVRGLVEREQLDFSGALPPAVALRKEAATFPHSLLDLRSETSVREVLEDYNRRVRRDRLRPPEPGMPQLLAPTVDVDDLVAQWQALRAEHDRAAQDRAAQERAGADAEARGRESRSTHTPSRWWHRLRRRT
ncbi:MAG TPA: DUF1992 domain-containing protein [Intrasporangiaceae bacterium]|nr:DUF1992 domain-containing protein [Intrasporangiaceae bacterium]